MAGEFGVGVAQEARIDVAGRQGKAVHAHVAAGVACCTNPE